MCSLLLLGILITSKLYPGELLQKRNSGQPNLYLKIPHRPTEQDSDEFHRQLRATQGKCFQIVLNYWMQNACLSAFPIPFFALFFCQSPCTPTHAYATHTPATGWQRDLMWVLPSLREIMIRFHTYWPFIILSQTPVHSSEQFKRWVLPLFPFYNWRNCSFKRLISYQREVYN